MKLAKFTGKKISDSFMSFIQNELELFLKNEFTYFRDRAEEISLDNEEAGEVVDFGNGKMIYYIFASLDEDKEGVSFDIYDENNKSILEFTAGRMSGKLKSVNIGTKNAKAIENALYELNSD